MPSPQALAPLDIRPARPPDCPTLLGLIRELAVYEKLEDQVVASPAMLETELFGERPVIEAALAWEGPAAVGFALWFENFSTFLGRRGLYLEDLYVIPAARRRGVGRALLEHVASLAARRGCGRLDWSVLEWNGPAIRFYRAMGAEVLPDWRVCRLTGDALARFAPKDPPIAEQS
jgi:GNAT superfamily N-acetyltransferase